MGTWFRDVVTQAFNPPIEPGVDIGTPFHTPITALAGGTVVSETTGGFGQRVDVRMPNGETSYYQHLDAINPSLHVGTSVMPGEVLGLSGGQLSGGAHPNSPVNSTGPHIEVGLYNSSSGAPINPAAFIGSGGGGVPFLGDAATSRGQNIPGAPGTVPGNSGGTPVTGMAGPDPSGGSLVNVNFPNPFAGLSGWIGSATSSLTGALQANIIPLVVAGLIILVVLGSGEKSQPAPAPPQIIPVPV